MFKVSEIYHTPPKEFASELQKEVYSAFDRLGIPFGRVDTDPGITMEDCRHIDEKIGVRIVKTIFLCNRQQTEFYLYVTTDDKPFVTREFCGDLTGVVPGAPTILSAILPQASGIHLVMDRIVAGSEWFACTDGTATCFVKTKTSDLIGKYLKDKELILI